MKFQPELDKAQMMWRRISSYKSKFTSEKFQVGDLNQFLTHTHMPVFLVLILDFGLPVHCWDTELWFFFFQMCPVELRALPATVWELIGSPDLRKLQCSMLLLAAFIRISGHALLLRWVIALFLSLRDPCLLQHKATEPRVQSCCHESCVAVHWNAAGILEHR